MKIIYKEDVVRAKFYRTFGEEELVNLFNEEKPTSQLFVEKYLAIAESGSFEEKELWDRTVSEMERDGVDLKGNQASSSNSNKSEPQAIKMSFKDLFKEG